MKKIYLGGTFDLYHTGHINLFKQAKEIADFVIVALNTDEFNEKYKGNRPIMDLAERTKLVGSCKYVDKVDVNEGGKDSKPCILRNNPDYILHGSDWAGKSLMEQMDLTPEFLKENKIEMKSVPYTKGVSTSDLLMRIRRGPQIIAVDMDKTLCKGTAWSPDDCLTMEPIQENRKLVNLLHLENFIIIYTARRDDLIPNTIRWLKENGIMFQAISNNKMPADYYIDDKAIDIKDLYNKLKQDNGKV